MHDTLQRRDGKEADRIDLKTGFRGSREPSRGREDGSGGGENEENKM